jgi:cellobiose-specific phosphotransferase system component IIA
LIIAAQTKTVEEKATGNQVYMSGLQIDSEQKMMTRMRVVGMA